MNAAEVLRAARAAGVKLGVEGNDLLLEASTPPPPAVFNLLTLHKAAVVELLRPKTRELSTEDWLALFDERAGRFEFDNGLSRTDADHCAFEACVVEWLNRNPAPSPAGRCEWCRKPEASGAIVLPFGVEPKTHTWLHAECWPAWHQRRQAQATAALREMGIYGK